MHVFEGVTDQPSEREANQLIKNQKLNLLGVEVEFVEAIAEVVELGARKYGDQNWQTRPIEDFKKALYRHWFAYLKGDTFDDESGLEHIAHLACNAMFILALDRESREDHHEC